MRYVQSSSILLPDCSWYESHMFVIYHLSLTPFWIAISEFLRNFQFTLMYGVSHISIFSLTIDAKRITPLIKPLLSQYALLHQDQLMSPYTHWSVMCNVDDSKYQSSVESKESLWDMVSMCDDHIFVVMHGSLCRFRNKILYILLRRIGYELTSMLFWCFFSFLLLDNHVMLELNVVVMNCFYCHLIIILVSIPL